MGKRLLPLLSLLAILLVTAGCSAEAVRNQANRLVAQARLASEAGAIPDSPANRVLIAGADGNLFLAAPDGSERFALTTDASNSRRYVQPTWAPDGERIAWARLDGARSFLETSRFDGSERSELAVPFPPFYIYWSPTSDRLAYLSNWMSLDQPSMALRLFDVAQGAVTTLAEGQPFYFSWAPDGQRLLTHIGNERVEVQSIDGAQESLLISGGVFPAPQWAPDGERLVYATADTGSQRLIVADTAGQELAEVTDYPGRISFSLSGDSSRLAYVVTDRDSTSSTLGPLYVVDVDSRRTREITGNPVLAFYWSPSGDKLAYLGLEFVEGRLGLRWYVWDGQQSTPYAAYFPSRIYLDSYLPFFDQYAQSHRIWSPDGDAFVFTGTLPDGRSGVWVQALAADSEPLLVGPGVFATWSPQ